MIMDWPVFVHNTSRVCDIVMFCTCKEKYNIGIFNININEHEDLIQSDINDEITLWYS